MADEETAVGMSKRLALDEHARQEEVDALRDALDQLDQGGFPSELVAVLTRLYERAEAELVDVQATRAQWNAYLKAQGPSDNG